MTNKMNKSNKNKTAPNTARGEAPIEKPQIAKSQFNNNGVRVTVWGRTGPAVAALEVPEVLNTSMEQVRKLVWDAKLNAIRDTDGVFISVKSIEQYRKVEVPKTRIHQKIVEPERIVSIGRNGSRAECKFDEHGLACITFSVKGRTLARSERTKLPSDGTAWFTLTHYLPVENEAVWDYPMWFTANGSSLLLGWGTLYSSSVTRHVQRIADSMEKHKEAWAPWRSPFYKEA